MRDLRLALAVYLLVGCSAIIGCARRNPGPTANTSKSVVTQPGADEAQADLKQGVLKLKEYPPTPAPAYHGDYIRLLKEKCGVEYEVVSSLEYSESIAQDVRAYNDVMKTEIQKRFGAGVLEKLHKEAEESWSNRRNPPRDK